MRILLCTVFSMVLFGQTAVKGDIILSLDGCDPNPCGDCTPLGEYPALNCWTMGTPVPTTSTATATCQIQVALLQESHFGRRMDVVDAAFVVTRERRRDEVFRCDSSGLVLTPTDAARATWSWNAERGVDTTNFVASKLEELLAANRSGRVELLVNVVSRASINGSEALLLSFRRFGGSREYQAFVLQRCGVEECQVASAVCAPGGGFIGGTAGFGGGGGGAGGGFGALGLAGLAGLAGLSGGGNDGFHGGNRGDKSEHTHSDKYAGKPGGHPEHPGKPGMPGKPWTKPEKPWCPPPMHRPGGGVTAVPEPSSLALLSVAGLGGLACRRFRKKRS
jgi:hypothetical protein